MHHAICALLNTCHQPIPFPHSSPLWSPRFVSHSLSCFIPPSDYPLFLYPFLLLPIFLLLMFHRWEKLYDNCLSLLDLFHLALSLPVPSMLHKCWEIILLDSWIIFHCIYGPQLLNPVICWRASRLIPWFSYCGHSCYEHWGAYGPSLHYVCIFGVNTQLRNYWIIG